MLELFNHLAADSTFWNLTIGTVIQVVSLAITLFILVWRMSASQTKLQDGLGELKKISERVEDMDKTGTVHSRIAILGESELSKANAAQISVLTAAQIKLGPELAAVRTDLDWIKRTMLKNGQTPH